MHAEDIRDICLGFNGVTEDIKWGNHLCFCIGEKIFVVIAVDESPVRASLKVTEEQFDAFVEQDGFQQAPYFAKKQWVSISDINLLNIREWEEHLKIAYRIIAGKLTKKLQTQLKTNEV